MGRPLKLLATRSIVHIVGLLFAYNFGVYCIALSTFAHLEGKVEANRDGL